MAKEIVVFDFFGVICSEIAPFWLVDYFSQQEAIEIKAKIVHAADIGEISQQQMFDELGKLANISAEQVEREWWSYVKIDDSVVDIVRELRRNYPVSLLSNSPAQWVRDILKKYDLYPLFDVITISSEEHCAKPNLLIYQRMIRRLSAPAETMLMIDDNPLNVKAAKDIGMKGLLFESSTQLRKALIDQSYFVSS